MGTLGELMRRERGFPFPFPESFEVCFDPSPLKNFTDSDIPAPPTPRLFFSQCDVVGGTSARRGGRSYDSLLRVVEGSKGEGGG